MTNGHGKLVFVYNADSGLFSTLTDIAHKIFSPETYACSLCSITHGSFGMREEWKNYLETLRLPLEFLHRDELGRVYPEVDAELPVILTVDDGKAEVLATAGEIGSCRTVAELKDLVAERLVRNRGETRE